VPSYTKPRSRVIAVAKTAIAQARDSAGSDVVDGSILLRDILQSNLDDPGSTSVRNTLFHCVLPYFAGVETTSATATYALYLIHKHPEVLGRIRKEVDDLFCGPPLTQETLFRSTPVLHGAVTEAMRLYPIASFLIRVAARDFEFAGHRVKRGEHVFIGTTVPHFLAEHYPHPMVFDVDRYRGSAVPHRNPGAYSPFGRGPHMCIGKGLAETLMQLTLARIIHRRELELTSPSFRLFNRVSSSSPSGRFALNVTGVRQ
jgi:cytochrome P450